MRHLEQEEIQGKLETFPETFKARFGNDLNKDLVIQILQEQLSNKEKQLIKEAFSDLSPNNIRYVIGILERAKELTEGYVEPKNKWKKK